METVDVLGHHGAQFTFFFELRKIKMGLVWSASPSVQLLPVVLEKDLRLPLEAVAAQQVFRRVPLEIDVVAVVKSVLASEIRYPAFRGPPRPAEENDLLRRADHLAQFNDFLICFHHAASPVSFILIVAETGAFFNIRAVITLPIDKSGEKREGVRSPRREKRFFLLTKLRTGCRIDTGSLPNLCGGAYYGRFWRQAERTRQHEGPH